MQIDISGVECYVAIVSYDGKVAVEYLAGLVSAAQHGLQFDMGINKGNSIIQAARNEAVHGFMTRSKAQKLIFIDCDIGFQAQDLLRLVASSTRYLVVGGMYCTKDNPVRFTANPDHVDNKLITDRYGLMKMVSMPLGFSVIDRSVFEKFSDFPKYERRDEEITEYFRIYNNNGKLVGEDIDFCEQLYNNDIGLWCDPMIQLQHLGTASYKGDFIEALRKQDFSF